MTGREQTRGGKTCHSLIGGGGVQNRGEGFYGAKRGLCPCRKQRIIDENGKKMANGHSVHKKTRALLLRPLKTMKMTGVTHAKTLFAKSPVFAPPICELS